MHGDGDGYDLFNADNSLVTFNGLAADVFAFGLMVLALTTGSGGTANPVPEGSELADLLDGVLCPDVSRRLNIHQVLVHPWLAGHVPPRVRAAAQRQVHRERQRVQAEEAEEAEEAGGEKAKEEKAKKEK
eukprot:gene7312-3378_t